MAKTSKAEARDVGPTGLPPSKTAVRDSAGQRPGGSAKSTARLGLPGKLATTGTYRELVARWERQQVVADWALVAFCAAGFVAALFLGGP